MQNLTDEGRRIVEDVARRHGVSTETVATLLQALVAGQGGQAQFNIAELGGMGQWSRGGMTMVGDMFNNGLKARVDTLCSELSGLVGGAGLYRPSQSQSQGGAGVSLFVSGSSGSGTWWPGGLGHAAAVGAQNDLRYAVFPETRRLVIDQGGQVTVYDTGDHRIGGVSQQQSGDQSLTFTSQHGLVRVSDLPVADAPKEPPAAAAPAASAPVAAPDAPKPIAEEPARPVAAAPAPDGSDDIFGKLERLADLRQKGVLTDLEFEAKKAELLARL